jgi:hypothetical protein
MADVAQVWSEALPTIRQGVTGVGVWTALNTATPIALEDGVFVIGLPGESGDLSGHLRLPSTKRLMDVTISKILNSQVVVRIVDGTSLHDWEIAKRRDAERKKLQQAEMTKMRAEMVSRTSWDTVYEQLSRRYAAVNNKSLPQNRARFYEEAVAVVAEARQSMSSFDESGERNFARCIERIAQYSEVPSCIVGVEVLKRAGEL